MAKRDSPYAAATVLLPEFVVKKQVTVYVVKNKDGKYFCGKRNGGRKAPYSTRPPAHDGWVEDIALARFYPNTSVIKTVTTGTTDKPVRVVLTVESEEELDFS